MSSSYIKFIPFAIFPLVLALFLTLAPSDVKLNQNEDYKNEYFNIGLNIAKGRRYDHCSNVCLAAGLSDDLADAEFRRSPVLPFTIAAAITVFNETDKERVAQIIFLFQFFLGCCVASFIYCLGRQVFRRESLLFCGMVSSYPFLVYIFKQVNSEAFLLFFGFGGLVIVSTILCRNDYYSAVAKALFGLFAGVFFGLALSSKLTGIVFLIASLIVLCGRKSFLTAACVFGGSLLVFVFVNSQINADFAQSSRQHFVGTVIATGFSWEYIPGRPPSIESFLLSEGALGIMNRTYTAYINFTLTNNDLVFEHLLSELRGDPLAFVNLLLVKCLRVFYASDSRIYDMYGFILNLIYFFLIIDGAIRYFFNRGDGDLIMRSELLDSHVALLILTFLGFFAVVLLVTPLFRYLLPGFLCLLPFAGISLSSLVSRVKM